MAKGGKKGLFGIGKKKREEEAAKLKAEKLRKAKAEKARKAEVARRREQERLAKQKEIKAAELSANPSRRFVPGIKDPSVAPTIKGPVPGAIKPAKFDPKKTISTQMDVVRDQLIKFKPNSKLTFQAQPPKLEFATPGTFTIARPDMLPSRLEQAAPAFDGLRDNVPVLMFPVRIETKFSSNKTRLRIRVFPDQVGVDAFDPLLTSAETENGLACLAEMKKAQNEKNDPSPIWKAFVGASPNPARAVHVLQTLRKGRPPALRQDDQVHISKSPVLPERWCVTAYAKGQIAFEDAGALIPQGLAFSPNITNEDLGAAGLTEDPALKWMFDFNEAKSKGMALDVAVPSFAREEIDELFVVGIVRKDPADSSKTLTPFKGANTVAKLLAAHHGDSGGAFVPQGSATNNTQEVNTPWSPQRKDLDALYAQEWLNTTPPHTPSKDERLVPAGRLAAADDTPNAASRLAKAMGLRNTTVLSRFEFANSGEDAAMHAMNVLMWPVTWGEVFSTMTNGRSTEHFSDETGEWMRDWFVDRVRGGAALPVFQVGQTPYGVLPVMATTRAFSPAHLTGEPQKQQMLESRLLRMLPDWQQGATHLPQVSRNPEGYVIPEMQTVYDQPGGRLLEVLRKNPHPVTYSQTRAKNERSIYDLRYELRNLLVHPDHTSHALRLIFRGTLPGIPDGGADIQNIVMWLHSMSENDPRLYTVWPDTFRDGEHQRQVLSEKRQFLNDIKRTTSWIYGGSLSGDLKQSLYDAYVKPHLSLIDALLDSLDYMIGMSLEHGRANYGFEVAFDPPSSMYNGVIGYQSEDPTLSFMAYDENPVEWAANALTVVPKSDQTISPRRYIDALIGYANSFVSAGEPPEEPNFPNQQKPLFYRLLREAIYRTGTDDLPGLKIIQDAERFKHVNVTERVGIVRDLEVRDVTELTHALKTLNTLKTGSRVPKAQESLARSIRTARPEDLRLMATTLSAESKKKVATKKVSATQMRALSAELKKAEKLTVSVGGTLKFAPAPVSRRARMGEMTRAMDLLRELNAEQIELLMTQTMGLASWRLDAWITSLAHARLDEMRQTNATGLQLGCFGWVHNLKSRSTDTDVESQGFIHTPSLTHAKTAAVLRSGWTTYGSDEQDSPMAVDLSSERMREAKWIFDAMRQGQDLGDILGAKFERHLKTNLNAPEWIYPVREAVLAITKTKLDPVQPVVDGLELDQIWEDAKLRDAFDKAALEVFKKLGGRATAKSMKPVAEAVAYMKGLHDALADAAVSDSVFSMVQGNYSRAGATLGAISDGSVPSPELEILKTLPPAKGQTHRVALFTPQDGKGWSKSTVGAAAAPELEAIAAHLMGPASALGFTGILKTEDDEVIARQSFTWADMLSKNWPGAGGAAEVLMMLTDDSLEPGGALHLRALAFARSLLGEQISSTKHTLSLYWTEAQTKARDALIDRWLGWKSVIMNARALHPRDFVAEGHEVEGAQMAIREVETRANQLSQSVAEAIDRVLSALPAPTEGDPTPIGTRQPARLMGEIAGLSGYGFTQAIESLHSGLSAAEDVYALAWALAPDLRKRMKAMKEAQAMPATDPDLHLKREGARIAAALGRKLPAICALRFKLLPQLGRNFSGSSARTKDTKPQEWLEKWGYVRPALRDVSDALAVQDCYDATSIPMFVGQWPETKQQPWIATSSPRGPDTPKLSMLALTPGAGRKQWSDFDTVSGLLIDEIADRVPETEIDTGLTFHFDAPNTEAPQSLLLAVPPRGHSWDYDLMINTLRDTYNLARIRAVDGHAMSAHNQVLPAIYGPKQMGAVRATT